MNTLLKSLSLMILSTSFLSVSAMEHGTSQITHKHHVTKGLIGGYIVGVTCIAGYAALKVLNIAQEQHHSDPVSEATAAFLITELCGACIGKVGYYFCHNSSPSPQPVNTIRGPSKRFLKNKAKSHAQRNYQQAVHKANKQRDNIVRKK